jgi:hypothetical protein
MACTETCGTEPVLVPVSGLDQMRRRILIVQ